LIACAGITHKEADVKTLEEARFESEDAAAELKESLDLDGCVILQTCNRVEVYGSGVDDPEILREAVHPKAWVKTGREAVEHLFRVACGLESMMVGETEILRQVKEAYDRAAELGTLDPVLKTVFRRAISLGKRARTETAISEGAVSIGSAAVELAERVLGDLSDKTVLVVGAGEMGKTVTKALADRGVSGILVANRTYERAVKLAKELGGKAVRFDELVDHLAEADVVVSATAAPHPVITVDQVEEALSKREKGGKLLIVDIANPRDVEEGVGDLPGVVVKTIDDLREIARENLERRRSEIPKVERMIEEELDKVEKDLRRIERRALLGQIAEALDRLKQKELERALNRLRATKDPETVLKDFAEAYTKRLISALLPAVEDMPEDTARELAERIAHRA